MSHLMKIKTEVRDPTAIQAACQRLQLPPAVFGTAKLYSESATGWQVKLRDWKYPAVFDAEQGEVKFDTFEGRWGDGAELGKFLQAYAIERAKLEARKEGHSVCEQQLAGGFIKLQIAVAG
jgi:hypothetical protein